MNRKQIGEKTGRIFEQDQDDSKFAEELERRMTGHKALQQQGQRPFLPSTPITTISETTQNVSNNNVVSLYDIPGFMNPEHKFVLFNIAHRAQVPKSTRPAFRILGFFPTMEELTQHVKSCGVSDCHMWSSPVPGHITLCTSTEKQLDAQTQYSKKKAEEMVQRYMDDKKRRDEEFKINREKKMSGKQGLSMDKVRELNKQRREERRKKTTSSRTKVLEKKNTMLTNTNTNNNSSNSNIDETKQRTTNVQDLPASAQRRKQEFAVVTILKDITTKTLKNLQEPEPVICFWRAFPTFESAKEWMTGTAARYIRYLTMDIVDMYEWLHPEDVNADLLEEGYRDPDQQNIMKRKKIEKDKVLDFEKWNKEEGREMPVTEIVATVKDSLLPESAKQVIAQPTFKANILETDGKKIDITKKDDNGTNNSSDLNLLLNKK